jgi:hypothetical protein
MKWTYSVPDGRAPLVRDIAAGDLNQTKVYEFPANAFPAGTGIIISDSRARKEADGFFEDSRTE